MPDFLFEIGLEEIPARMIPGAQAELLKRTLALLTREQLIAADPSLDFVNTLDNRFVASGPVELLYGYEDLLRFVEQAGIVDAKIVAALARNKNSAAAGRSCPASTPRRPKAGGEG